MGREPTRQQYSSGLTYVQNKPAFLQNFGKPAPQPDASSSRGRDDGNGARAGREPLPERPREGEWAGGSDDEGKRGEESDDEWGDVYGGGGDDGPQVVVLKEGRHLTADDVRKERRRAAGKASVSPPPEKKPSTSASGKETTTKEADGKAGTKAKPVVPKPNAGAKRKLVGEAVSAGQASDTADKGKKKKKKAEKGLLSFNEADGES